MSISERRALLSNLKRAVAGLAFVATAACFVTTASCGPNEECLRVSDCSEGYVCAAGRCRSPEELASADLQVEAGEGGRDATSDAKSDGASSTAKDAATDGGSTPRDAGTSSDAPAG